MWPPQPPSPLLYQPVPCRVHAWGLRGDLLDNVRDVHRRALWRRKQFPHRQPLVECKRKALPSMCWKNNPGPGKLVCTVWTQTRGHKTVCLVLATGFSCMMIDCGEAQCRIEQGRSQLRKTVAI